MSQSQLIPSARYGGFQPSETGRHGDGDIASVDCAQRDPQGDLQTTRHGGTAAAECELPSYNSRSFAHFIIDKPLTIYFKRLILIRQSIKFDIWKKEDRNENGFRS